MPGAARWARTASSAPAKSRFSRNGFRSSAGGAVVGAGGDVGGSFFAFAATAFFASARIAAPVGDFCSSSTARSGRPAARAISPASRYGKNARRSFTSPLSIPRVARTAMVASIRRAWRGTSSESTALSAASIASSAAAGSFRHVFSIDSTALTWTATDFSYSVSSMRSSGAVWSPKHANDQNGKHRLHPSRTGR